MTIALSQRHALAANLICLGSMLTWAAGLPAAQMLIPLIPPVTLTAFRCIMAAAVLMPLWWLVDGSAVILRASWGRAMLVGGVCIGVAAVLLVVAQANTDPVTVAVATAVMPVIGITMEVVLDGRKLTYGLIIGLILGLIGGYLAFNTKGGSVSLGIGALAAVLSVLAFTWGSRATVTAFPDLTPLGRTAITVTSAAVVTSVAALGYTLLGGPAPEWAAIGANEIGALMLFGVGALAISQILWIMAVGSLGIGLSSLHMNAVPFYVMLILFVLGRGWNWDQAIGAAVVGLGVLIAQGLIRLPR